MAGTRLALERRSMAQQVRDDLRDQMRNGTLAVGARLPSEPESCEIYGVSRATVREAYRLLEQEGLVGVRRGAGRFVLPGATVVVQGSVNLIQSTTALLSDLGYDPRIELIGVTERNPLPEEATAFGLSVSDTVLRVERAYVSRGELLNHAVNVFDPERLPRPVDEMEWTGSVAEAFGAVGRDISAGITDVSAASLPEALVERYAVPQNTAWLRFDGPLFDQEHQPLWWSYEMWRSDVRVLRVVNRREPETA
ncbi:putative HTH-type transcriptional regulator YmfC [Streptomyces hygroscopicus subsp. sporocinereus]|uniref:HTH-type transcriptional regulator YmfC n=2 Tax=Streptomyces TaxID=1883 RepID=A0ABQ3TV49_STRHY|nr:putative HTH-type transcriptional regulator YmfC [Streptomyces hygroscopicus]